MLTRFPKDDSRFRWTRHIKNKMLFYGLSEQRIKLVLSQPKRKEDGVAPKTVAVMKRNDRGKRKEEVWVMYQKLTHSKKLTTDNEKNDHELKVINYDSRTKLIMISAWRYPGISKPGREIPIPEEIREELGL